MYKNQTVEILLNNGKAGTYEIKNGVKQGDALSCILFILCMEPLIRNISQDISIDGPNLDVPKVVAYADDVACIIKPHNDNLTKIFNHYNELTEVSGLKLNAEKTEILTKGGPSTYNINYQGKSYSIKRSESMKVNGIILSYDDNQVKLENITKLYNAMSKQLKQWSNRGLSLLGKIQIFKTFGLSQILYIGSVIMLNKRDVMKLNELIYRFIWNRDMNGNKAPDRIKRTILKKSIRELGFGMLDFDEVLRSIRLKTIMRILNQENHPLNGILHNNLSRSWVKIKCLSNTRECLDQPIKDIAKIWKSSLKHCDDSMVDSYLNIIKKEYIGNLLINKHKNNRLSILHRNDTVNDILLISPTHPVLKKLDKDIYNIICRADITKININRDVFQYDLLPFGHKTLTHTKVTSKIIRSILTEQTGHLTPKIIPDSTVSELKVLSKNIRSLTNIRLKTIILRSIHGDIYCGIRLKRFGMTETDVCQRCGLIENIDHLIFSCNYTTQLWKLVSQLTGIPNLNVKTILGANENHDKTTLTLHAELIRVLLSIDRPTTPPNDLLAHALERLKIIEKGAAKYQIKQMIEKHSHLIG